MGAWFGWLEQRVLSHIAVALEVEQYFHRITRLGNSCLQVMLLANDMRGRGSWWCCPADVQRYDLSTWSHPVEAPFMTTTLFPF